MWKKCANSTINLKTVVYYYPYISDISEVKNKSILTRENKIKDLQTL